MAISVLQTLSPAAAAESLIAGSSGVSSSARAEQGVRRPSIQQPRKAGPLGARLCSKVISANHRPQLELWQERGSWRQRLPGTEKSKYSHPTQETLALSPLFEPAAGGASARRGGGGQASGGGTWRRTAPNLSPQGLWQQPLMLRCSAVVARPQSVGHPGRNGFQGELGRSRTAPLHGRKPGVCSASGDLPRLPGGNSVGARERATGASEDGADGAAGGEGLGGGNEELQGIQVQLDLPRRRLMFSFTCKRCEGRSSRLVNPEVLRRGTTFVQCGTCEVWHQIVDNLNLIREYDLRLGTETRLPQVMPTLEDDNGDSKNAPQ